MPRPGSSCARRWATLGALVLWGGLFVLLTAVPEAETRPERSVADPAPATLPPANDPTPPTMAAVLLPPPPTARPVAAPTGHMMAPSRPGIAVKPMTAAPADADEQRRIRPLAPQRPLTEEAIGEERKTQVVPPAPGQAKPKIPPPIDDPAGRTAADPAHPVKPEAARETREAGRETREVGRVLLRLLEHGDGPAIEIAWPDARPGRERLYRLFTLCLEMRVAHLSGDGALYVAAGPGRRAWTPNVDRYSGFLRRPSGPATAAEAEAQKAIHRHHGDLPPGAAVRLFPRRADALLIGGLSRIIGAGYRGARRITARYDLSGGGLAVTGIRIDGRVVSGRVDLSPLMSASCSKGA